MRVRIFCSLVCLMLTVSLLAGEAATKHSADQVPAETAPVMSDPDVPRVSLNQTRPLRVGTNDIFEPTPVDPDDPYGYTGSCLKKHKCSGGSICATGNCNADETGNGCAWCTGFKCKSCRAS